MSPRETQRLKLTFDGQTLYAHPILPRDNQDDVEWVAALGVDPLAKPGGHTLRVYDTQGKQLAATVLEVQDAKFRKQYITVSGKTAGLQAEAGELEKVQALKDAYSPTRYWPVPLALARPVAQCANSPFGVKRIYNGVFSGSYHKGLDQRSPQGEPIRAAAGGVVKIAQKFGLHGGTVGIDHGQGLTSIYIHMSRIDVKPGQAVAAGETIGRVGATGFASGPHLHWGVYMNGIPVDPHALTPGISSC